MDKTPGEGSAPRARVGRVPKRWPHVDALVRAALLMGALQLGRWAFESVVFALVPHTLLANELVRAVSFLLMFAAVAALARRSRTDLHLLPAGRPGWGYLVTGALFALLFVATPFVTGQRADLAAWAALACGTLATPLAEEALFRGYLWERLRPVFGGGWKLVLATALLFGLWHLGYTDAVAWRVAQPDAAPLACGGVAHIMLMKTLFATGMGMVLGAIRMKWGTCLSSGLFHAIWNCLA